MTSSVFTPMLPVDPKSAMRRWANYVGQVFADRPDSVDITKALGEHS